MEETTLYRKYEYDQIEKLVKLIGCTYACNSLTDFEYEELAITSNGNNVNQLTLAGKIRENTYFNLEGPVKL